MRAGVDAGVRLGLGKQQEDDHYTNPELIERKKLETEIQADEDEDRRRKREVRTTYHIALFVCVYIAKRIHCSAWVCMLCIVLGR